MSERIPKRIDYHRYTDKGVILDGLIKQSELETDLPRLFEAIVKPVADIEYHLEFSIDVSSNRIMTGWLKTQVILQCQRCMQDYVQDLSCEVSTAFVKNDFETKQAEASKHEIFCVGQQNSIADIDKESTTKKAGTEKLDCLNPMVLIEDELLLALPQIAKHSETGIGTDCHMQFDYPMQEQDIQQQDDNPFAILEQLKKH